jgi:phage anti-repressor protein
MDTKINKKLILSSERLNGFTDVEKKDFEKLIDRFNDGGAFYNQELIRIKKYTSKWNNANISQLN